MMFIRSKKKDNKIYYYIVESIRKGKKVQQKVLMYLGSVDKILEVFRKHKRAD